MADLLIAVMTVVNGSKSDGVKRFLLKASCKTCFVFTPECGDVRKFFMQSEPRKDCLIT